MIVFVMGIIMLIGCVGFLFAPNISFTPEMMVSVVGAIGCSWLCGAFFVVGLEQHIEKEANE